MHDKFGNSLAVGDRVLVEAIVKECQSGEEYCNVTLETEEVMFPGTNKSTIVLNTKQVMKAERMNWEDLPKKDKGTKTVIPLGETLGPGSPEGNPPPDQPPSQGGGN